MMDLWEVILAMSPGGVIVWLFMSSAQLSAAYPGAQPKPGYRLFTRENVSGRSSDAVDWSASPLMCEDGEPLSARMFAVSCRRAQREMAFEARFRAAVPTYILVPSFEWDSEFRRLFDSKLELSCCDVARRYDDMGQRYGVFVPHAVRPLCIIDFYHTPFDLAQVPPPLVCRLGMTLVRVSDLDDFDDAAIKAAVASALCHHLRAPLEQVDAG